MRRLQRVADFIGDQLREEGLSVTRVWAREDFARLTTTFVAVFGDGPFATKIPAALDDRQIAMWPMAALEDVVRRIGALARRALPSERDLSATLC